MYGLIADASTCQRLADIVTSLGTTLPDALARPLAAYDLAQRARRGEGTNHPGSIAELMTSGEPVTLDSFVEFVDYAALAGARAQVTVAIAEEAERVLIQVFRNELIAAGGDELTDRLRPAFDAAVDQLHAMMSKVSPGMTAADVIDAGPEVLKAWGDGGGVARTFAAFDRYAIAIGRDMGMVTKPPLANHPSSAQVVWFVDPSTDPELDRIGYAYSAQDNSRTHRGGTFHAMVTNGGAKLHLNSPREAAALCEAYNERLRENVKSNVPLTTYDPAEVA